jgi:uncharacterized protein
VIVVDANLLIYAVDRDAPRHQAARRWLEDVLSAPRPVGFAWSVLLAFLRVTTRPGILVRPLEPGAALGYVDEWLEQPNAVALVAGPQHWRILRRLLANSGTAGNLTSDAHLAALAIEQGATLCSTDYDFKRFAGLDHVDPLAGG